jgi:hypothetical protein
MEKGLSVLVVMLFCMTFVLASSAEVLIYTESPDVAEDVSNADSGLNWVWVVSTLIATLIVVFVILHSKKKVVKSKAKKKSVKKKVSKKKASSKKAKKKAPSKKAKKK